MRHQYGAAQQGFAIIEALIGTIILAIAITGIMTFLPTFYGEISANRDRTVALTLADEKLNELRVFAHESVCLDLNGSDEDEIIRQPVTFSRGWTVEDHTSASTKQLTVSVEWTDSDSQTQTVHLSSSAACYDPVAGGIALAQLYEAAHPELGNSSSDTFVAPTPVDSPSTDSAISNSDTQESDEGQDAGTDDDQPGETDDSLSNGSDTETDSGSTGSSGTVVAPSTPNVSRNGQTLSWDAISGAAVYKVYSCSTSGSKTLNSCTPSSLSETGSSTSFTLPTPSNKQTRCFNITSSNSAGESEPSSVFCVHKHGTISYSP